MKISQHTTNLTELIRYAHKDKSLELEARLKNTKNNQITSEVFFNVMKRLKGTPNIELISENTELDVSLVGDYNNMRVTIVGDQHITDYCQKNDIKLINPATVSFMKKTPVRHVDVNEYNLRFNLKREVQLTKTDPDVADILSGWTRLDKLFRYKKRFSFITKDGNFRFDLTTLKSSQKKSVRGKSKKMKKSDIKPYMIKYIIKPDYVVDTAAWLAEQPDSALIEMKGRNFAEMVPAKTLQKSAVLKNDLEYEIEVEYLGNKNQTKKSSISEDKKILMEFLKKIIIILQAVQKSYYIISELEKMNVIDQYKAIMGDYKFSGPMNVSLTLQNVIEKNYDEYSHSVNIRKGYSVTDKADGERNLLLILKGGAMYLINRKNDVKSLGANCPKLENSILDVEYLVKDKMGNNVNMILIFDAYFINGSDLRERILYRTEEEIQKNIVEQSRYEAIIENMQHLESLEKPKTNNLQILRKKFYFGDDRGVDQEVLASINRLKAYLRQLDTDSEVYKQTLEQLTNLKGDTKIFKEAHKVYTKEYPYNIDGLVFTPRSTAVGEETGKEKKNKFSGRWYSCFKWKPPDENTIDFLGVFKKEEGTNSYETKYITKGSKVIECRIMVLHVGYNPLQHTSYNSFKILNENVTFDSGYNPVPFAPTNPYKRDIHICYLPVENGNCYDNEGNIISDNNIVEFIYNQNKPAGFCWEPMRIRNTLKPNDFITANNVWTSLFNPVTLDMISTGNVDIGTKVYFDSNQKRSQKKTKPMNDFHSFVKKNVLVKNLAGEKSLLDIGVGKAGDMNHWLDAGCKCVVGFDSVKDNFDNPVDGGCNRILSRYGSLKSSNDSNSKERQGVLKNLLDNIMMVWADCSKNVLDSSAAQDDLSKYYLDILYGKVLPDEIVNPRLKRFYNIGSNFDMVISNFAIHYFFESKETLNNAIMLVSESLKLGGKFAVTTIDGNELFRLLEMNSGIYNGVELSWKIEKKYTQTTFPDNENSLGYKIGVYVESIGQSLEEYLVNTVYFEKICAEHKLKLVEKKMFRDIYTGVSRNNEVYGEMSSMSEEMKEYSFLNTTMVFEKISDDSSEANNETV